MAWLKLVTGKDYRLLSEAEWEYAARAGTATAYSFGDNYPPSKKICEYANFADITLKKAEPSYQTSVICDDGHVVPAPQVPEPIGNFKSNGFGLYHMHGNVLQWTKDCFVNTYEKAPTDGSPIETENCTLRVARGGSWYGTPEYLRSAFRRRYSPDYRLDVIGFRVGRTLKP
jgi:formylglycine-generating enzyme required for sulfatase activity